jgi:SAM-dependent methyltransferase
MKATFRPLFERANCLSCGSSRQEPFIVAEDDLTGQPGRFTFVRCADCGLIYQSPRMNVDQIRGYYSDEYIAHRKKLNWGKFTAFVEKAMDEVDLKKIELVKRYVEIGRKIKALDVGCGAGTFLVKLKDLYGSYPVGVDFVDLSGLPSVQAIEFHCGPFHELDFGGNRFDVISMWHFLEHDYDPLASLSKAREWLKPAGYLIVEVPRLDSRSYKLYRDRWPGLQAPQHTVLFTKKTLLRQIALARLEVVDYLAYGAFPAYFYLFAGIAFKILKGRGLDLKKAVLPYLLGRVLLSPLLLLETKLNLAMQTVVCRRAS